jgi:hypothetical protein
MGKQRSGALSKLLLKPANISEFIEDLLDFIPLTKGKNSTRRKQAKSSAHDEEYFEMEQGEKDDGEQDMVQPNIKFASLKEQSLFCSDITDDDPIESHDVKVG